MPRSIAAYLADIVDACDAIADVLNGVDFTAYENRRPVRSAVEGEFILIGDAVASFGASSLRSPMAYPIPARP
jgi:uncharacterized protein with HEPN domain